MTSKTRQWAAGLVLAAAASASLAEPTIRQVNYDDAQGRAVSIEVRADGDGPLIVMLPSLGRDADDYDVAVQSFVKRGYRVLRPSPRGIKGSTGPLEGMSLHDFANDVSQVIRREQDGPAVIVGHAYGNWVGRTLAVDHPEEVRGVVIAAAASKKYAPELSGYIDKCEDASLPDAERLMYLRKTFFAPASDPTPWLHGWHPDAKKAQRAARAATPTDSFWSGGQVPMLDLMAADDPFRLPATEDENRREFGERVSVAVIPGASHALIPEQPERVADAVDTWIRTSLQAMPAAARRSAMP